MGKASVPTPAVYPAFFFVLEKAVKGVGNAVIPTFPTRWSHGLQHLRHKRPTFAFTPESGYALGSAQRIAHNGLHAETGAVSDGGAITTLGAFHTFRKPCVARCQNGKLCRFGGLVKGAPEGVAAPLGCVIFFASVEIATCTPCAQGLSVCARRGVVSLPSARFTCC